VSPVSHEVAVAALFTAVWIVPGASAVQDALLVPEGEA
jgi:hypothetical protein